MSLFLRVSVRFMLICISLVVGAIPALAQIRESSDRLVDRVTEGTLERLLRLPFPLPTSLRSDRDVYLLVRIGAATWEARLLARPSVPPQHLAGVLQAALKSLPQHPDLYEWSGEEDYSAARCQVSIAHWGKHSSRISVPIGALVDSIRQAGWTPHALVRVPLYAEVGLTSLPQYPTQNWVWMEADTALHEDTLSLRVQLSSLDVFLPVLLIGGLPTIGILSLLAAIGSIHWKSRSLVQKRQLFLRLALWPVFAMTAIVTSIGFFYMSSDAAARVADLWLGQTTRAVTVSFVMPNVAFFTMLCLFSLIMQNKLLPQPSSAPVVPPTEETLLERQLRRRMAKISLLCWAVGVGLLLMRPFVLPAKHPLTPFWMMGALTITSFCSYLVQALFRKQLKAVEGATWDGELSQRLDSIARILRHRVTGVWVSHHEAAQQFIEITVQRPGRVVVTQRSVEVFSAAELDFLMACSLLRSAQRRSTLPGMIMLCILGGVASSALVFGLLGFSQAWKLPLTFCSLLALLLITALLARRSFLVQERRTLQGALAAMGDRESALSALAKQASAGGVNGDTGERQRTLQRQIEQLEHTGR